MVVLIEGAGWATYMSSLFVIMLNMFLFFTA
jgi:hypothetical protein